VRPRTGFVCLSSLEWQLHPRVRGSRRLRLLRGTSFGRIVQSILEQAAIASHKREKLGRGYYCAVVILEMDAALVDLFHNSAAGYRAQYYGGTQKGESANKYAIRSLSSRIIKLLNSRQKRTCPPGWLEKSILHPEAKLWIHQGRWLRLAKHSGRNLLVRRWLNQPRTPRRERKLRRWASLTPRDETRIDLKGAPIRLDGRPRTKSLKPNRGRDIHLFGYT